MTKLLDTFQPSTFRVTISVFTAQKLKLSHLFFSWLTLLPGFVKKQLENLVKMNCQQSIAWLPSNKYAIAEQAVSLETILHCHFAPVDKLYCQDMGICSGTTIISTEHMFLSSMDRYYCLYQPELGAGELKMNFLPSR